MSGFSSLESVNGRFSRFGIGANQVINKNLIRDPYVVFRGKPVNVVVVGEGFKISISGVSLVNASPGESAQVKTANGKLLFGVASESGDVIFGAK